LLFHREEIGLLGRPFPVIDRQIKREFEDAVPLLDEEILVVTRVGKMTIEDLADFIPDGPSGLAVLEPILHEHLGRCFGQALEQSLGREADLLLFLLGHGILAEKIVDFEFVFGETLTDVTFFFLLECLGKLDQLGKIRIG